MKYITLHYYFHPLRKLISFTGLLRAYENRLPCSALFSEAELDFNRMLRDEIKSSGFNVFLPQEIQIT